MQIGEATIKKMEGLAAEQLQAYAKKINEAFLKSEDGKLKVSLAFYIGVSGERANAGDIDATISFTTEKVKDKISTTVSENQTELFKAVEKLIPKKESGIDSVTISAPGSGLEPVTLKAR
jgi:hypothetical protein